MAYPETLVEKKLVAYDTISIRESESETVRGLAFSAAGGRDPIDGIVTRAMNAADYYIGGAKETAPYAEIEAFVLSVLQAQATLGVTGDVSLPTGTSLPTVIPPTAITHYAFRQRLTNAEKLQMDGIQFAAYPDAAALATPQGQLVAQVKTWINDFWSGQWVDLGQPALRDGLTSLEGALLAVGRAAEIYGAPIADSERPTI